MSAPVSRTCPQIDAVLKELKNAKADIQSVADELSDMASWSEDDELASRLRALVGALESAIFSLHLEDDMEDLRSANDALRSWGYELEKQINS